MLVLSVCRNETVKTINYKKQTKCQKNYKTIKNNMRLYVNDNDCSGPAVWLSQASIHRDNGDAHDGAANAVQHHRHNDLERPSWGHAAAWQRPPQTAAASCRQQNPSFTGFSLFVLCGANVKSLLRYVESYSSTDVQSGFFKFGSVLRITASSVWKTVGFFLVDQL